MMLLPTEIAVAINQAFAHGQSLALLTIVTQDGQTVPHPERALLDATGNIAGGQLKLAPALQAQIIAYAQQLIADETQEIVTHEFAGTRVLFEIARPPLELIVCGAGHVGQAVAKLGLFLGFQVTVIDDRAEFAARQIFPDERIRLYAEDFISALQKLTITPASHLVIVTRGHKHDEICLRAVLGKPARYLGMIGSRRRTTTIRAHLKKEGVSDQLLQQVYAPIGLDIGAQTPEEIAVAILAEIIFIRRGGTALPKSNFVRKN